MKPLCPPALLGTADPSVSTVALLLDPNHLAAPSKHPYSPCTNLILREKYSGDAITRMDSYITYRKKIQCQRDNVVYWKTKRKIKDDLQCNLSFKRISKRISIEVCG